MMAQSVGVGRHLCSVARASILALLLFDIVRTRPAPPSFFVVQAYPTGAGSCLAGDGGQALAHSPHGDFGMGSFSRRHGGHFTMEIANVTLKFGTMTLATTGTTVLLPIGQDVTWTLTAGRVPIRGYLVRLQAPDGTATETAISCGDDRDLAMACVAPIVGCTHSDNADKFEVTGGTVRFDNITRGVLVDVTVVFQNNFVVTERDDTIVSLFASGRYVVDFESPGSTGGFATFFASLRAILLLLTTMFGGGGGQ
jgi:hypothetical protein